MKFLNSLDILGSGGTLLDVQGSQGQLFSVTDSLSGSIFAVSDISGVPIMDVNSSGTSYFSGDVGIGTASPSQSLQVEGNADINGVLFMDYGSIIDDGRFRFGASNDFSLGFNSADSTLRLAAGNTLNSNVRLTVDSTGNVGIGTTAPLSQLSIGSNAITTKKPTVVIADGVAGGSLVIRGLSPILSFDRTGANPENKILMDDAGLEFKTGSLDAEGDVDFKIKLDGKLQAPAYTQGFLQSDASGNIEISGGGTLPGGPYLPLAGGTMSGPINMGDNEIQNLGKLIFATSK